MCSGSKAKYDDTAAAMIALLKYGCGLPFHRIARLEQGLAIPMPIGTQWEVVAAAAAPSSRSSTNWHARQPKEPGVPR